VIISRSVEMREAEIVLERAMVATITSTRPMVSAEEVAQVLYAVFQLKDGDFSVHIHNPEDFLIICSTKQIKDLVAGD
jgi:hypothetical protein